MTQLYGVIGDPIAHSLSPLIHNGWMRDNGIDATYAAMQVPDGELESALDTLTRQGARGLNITLPHKHTALDLAEETGDLARRIGAANTLIRTDSGGWRAENTDAPGFIHTLDKANIDVAGKNVLLLGAGGSARALAFVLTDMRAKLTISNRTISRAEAIAADLLTKPEICSLDEGMARLPTAELVINTLSLGHSGQALDLPPGHGRTFYDISYGAAANKTLAGAASQDWQTMDGLGMLVAQAAFAFEYWFGLVPDMEEAERKCRAAVEATS
ncbi:MAG: shikimate dehydrogenase [Hyphomonas sp.]|uniref:shikimate dehydrogenase n=1 Tax=Hyphomonas sp. TaxID=87 RepID=UPI003001692C